MAAAEFVLCCKNAGLAACEIDEWNIGTIIDFIHVKNKSMTKSDSAYSDDEKYKTLKTLEPKVDEDYKNGLIPKDKYDKFKQQLAEWE